MFCCHKFRTNASEGVPSNRSVAEGVPSWIEWCMIVMASSNFHRGVNTCYLIHVTPSDMAHLNFLACKKGANKSLELSIQKASCTTIFSKNTVFADVLHSGLLMVPILKKLWSEVRLLCMILQTPWKFSLLLSKKKAWSRDSKKWVCICYLYAMFGLLNTQKKLPWKKLTK